MGYGYDRGVNQAIDDLHRPVHDEVEQLHLAWSEYRALFAGSQETIDLLHLAARDFFVRLDDLQWSDILMRLCRLTDLCGTGGRERHSLDYLASRIVSPKVRAAVSDRVRAARAATAFARDDRDRRPAHRRLGGGKPAPARPLREASRRDVELALTAIRHVMVAVNEHLGVGPFAYDRTDGSLSGAAALVPILRLGVRRSGPTV